MFITFRRTLLLWLFMFWQGGFFFYASVVVKIGTDLHDSFTQGLITQQVTNWLNLAGLVTLLAWLWDLCAERRALLKSRCFLWIVMLSILAALAWLHPRMDALIDPERDTLLQRGEFRLMHRWYLYLSTAQWLASIAFSLCTLWNWRAADSAPLHA